MDRRSLLRSALIATALFGPVARAARAADTGDIGVTDAAGLAYALAAATGGETIRLAPGDYGRLVLGTRQAPGPDFPRPVTLVSADPADPAALAEVSLHGAGNMVFDGLLFDYRFTLGDKTRKQPFMFRDCSRLTICNSVFDGDVARGISPEEDGLGSGFGLSVGNGQDIRILNNRVRGFFRGMVIGKGRNVLVAGNELVGMRLDGMNFVAMQDVRIEGNHIHGFQRSTLKQDHADMIQFWTKNTDFPSTGITIRGNLMLAGDGNATHSILMGNEEVRLERAGLEMFYRDVLIEENVILNGHLHGISLGQSNGAVIRRNTVLRDPSFTLGTDRDKKVKIPRIRVHDLSVGVEVTDNIAYAVPAPQPGWRVEGNLLAQDRGRAEAGFYEMLFEPRPPSSTAGDDPARHVPFRVIPASAADRPGLGAALTR